MKSQLQLCGLATNPLSPDPVASMVRVSDGRMTAFSGIYCISTPIDIVLDCCFNPDAVSNFFRKPRKKVSYTIQKDKLVLQEGKERKTVRILGSEEMTTIAVLTPHHPCTLDMTLLKNCVDVIDPNNTRIFAQGVSFRNEVMEATNNSVVVSAYSGIEDVEFNLPQASAKALMKIKSPVVSVAKDQTGVCFGFKDGTTLTSLVLSDSMIPTNAFFKGPWNSLGLSKELAEDLLKLEYDDIEFKDGLTHYKQGEDDGEFTYGAADNISVATGKKSLDFLLKVSSDIRISEDNNRLQAFGENCRVVCSTRSMR